MITQKFIKDWNEYLSWMRDVVGCPDSRINLLNSLDNITFSNIANIRDDFNRIGDAVYMRGDFFYNNHIILDVPDNEIHDGFCSVLELLVAFAIRIDKEWTGSPGDQHPEIIFWKFMDNLGLRSRFCTGDHVQRIIHGWMNGNIDHNGMGGLFPLRRHPEIDQRDKSMWEQMMPWIAENFS